MKIGIASIFAVTPLGTANAMIAGVHVGGIGVGIRRHSRHHHHRHVHRHR
jgi:hypothetical protein